MQSESSTYTHQQILYDLNQSYQQIQTIVEELEILKQTVCEKIERFSGLYGELVRDHKTKTLLFCLDSLYFQYRISRINYESIENISKFILNRMYGDYYRLWRLITSNQDDDDTDSSQNIVVYRDLDVFYVYPMMAVSLLHEHILIVLQKMFVKWSFGARGVEEFVENKVSILPISNYLNTLQYENNLLNHQTMLYANYLAFFHVSQKRSLDKLKTRLTILNEEIDSCLKCDRILTVEDLFSNSPFCSRASTPRTLQDDIVDKLIPVEDLPNEMEPIQTPIKDSPNEMEPIQTPIKDLPNEMEPIQTPIKDLPNEMEPIQTPIKDSPNEMEPIQISVDESDVFYVGTIEIPYYPKTPANSLNSESSEDEEN